MRFIVILLALTVCVTAAAPAASQTLDAASAEALAATLRTLADPALRAGALTANPDGQAVDQKIRGLAGSDQLTEELYGLAAQIFDDVSRNQGGDVGKILGALEQGQKDPAAFAAMLSPETLTRLRELAAKISDQRK